MSALNSGFEAPLFDLPLLGGGQFSLRDALTQSPVVLAFFKVSCPVCQYAFPLYEQLATKTSDAVRVIGISQDDESASRNFAKMYSVTFPIALEDVKRYTVSNAYGLTNVPTLFEIAQDGRIAISCVGWDKGVVEDLYRRHAASAKPGFPLFPPSSGIADFRAG